MRAREDAAAELEAAIADLRVAYETYLRLTTELETQGQHPDLGRYLETAIAMQLHAAGLAPFLERKLPSPAGGPPSLRELTERQHTRTPTLT
jgi:hypothetical protein